METRTQNPVAERTVKIYNPLVVRPNLAIEFVNEYLCISWTKPANNSIDLFVDRSDGNNWVFLGRFNRNYFNDRTLFPFESKQWNYLAYYVIGDNQIGEISSIASVLVKNKPTKE